ncbi:MAG: ATP-binding cassette domain-containing protein [Planctomycetes bacterium]|nr:ATP-binding cassette domain-containing protein [Planctomycetota bacterium]
MKMVIKAQSISKKVKGLSLYNDLSFEAPAGSRLIITGANGTGKSILLMLLAGLLKPDEGALTLNTSKGVSWSPFHLGLDEFLSVKENISPWVDSKRQAQLQIALWGLESIKNKRLEKLSTGQRKRVLLSRAFGSKKDIILLDEPRAGLDSHYYQTLDEQMQKQQGRGAVIVIATHVPEKFSGENTQTISLGEGHELS